MNELNGTTLERPKYQESALALALSGGGLRATLFHLGVVERLYELGVLDGISYLSTVSGGSILGAWLALNWTGLLSAPAQQRGSFFEARVVAPLVALARADVRNRALRLRLRPKGWGCSGAESLSTVLDELLFRGATLGQLPPEPQLRVSLNATNLRNGKRFRFSRFSVGDYYGGYTTTGVPGIPVATAVAASAAFPGMFGPLRLRVQGPFKRWTFKEPSVLEDAPEVPGGCVFLMDGGIYDNIGLQAASQRCGRIIAVDAGQPLDVDFPVRWGRSTMLRSVDVMMSRIVNHPVSDFVQSLISEQRQGAFIRSSRTVEEVATRPADSPSLEPGLCPGLDKSAAVVLSQLRTDLDAFTDLEIELLRYHGRCLADVSVRRFLPSWIQQAPASITRRDLSVEERESLAKGRERSYLPALAVWRGW